MLGRLRGVYAVVRGGCGSGCGGRGVSGVGGEKKHPELPQKLTAESHKMSVLFFSAELASYHERICE